MYETIGNVYALIITIISLNLSIGQYMSTSKRCWLFMSFFLLSNNQLEMIIPRNDEIKAYLSECTLYATTNYKLYQEAIQVPKGSRNFKGTVRSDLYGMKISWNKWIMQAY